MTDKDECSGDLQLTSLPAPAGTRSLRQLDDHPRFTAAEEKSAMTTTFRVQALLENDAGIEIQVSFNKRSPRVNQNEPCIFEAISLVFVGYKSDNQCEREVRAENMLHNLEDQIGMNEIAGHVATRMD